MYNLTIPSHNLESFIHSVNLIPNLSNEEEKVLFEKWKEKNDLDAVKKIVLSNMKHVVYLAKSYSGYGLQLSDLVQEGTIGLMKAIRAFSVETGNKLYTFAVKWIKSEMNEFVLKNWSIVKIATTKAQRKLFFKMNKLKNIGTGIEQNSEQDISKEMNVSIKDVSEMHSRIYSKEVEYDTSESDTEENYYPVLYSANKTNPESLFEMEQNLNKSKEIFHLALNKLPNRTKDIILKRNLNEPKSTLDELSAEYGISKERVSQIEKEGITKMKSFVSSL